MKWYTLYSDNGKIVQNSFKNTPPVMTLYQDLHYIEGKYQSHSHYIKNEVATPRPEMSLTLDKQTIAADAEDMATISGIPAGATVTSSENSAVVDSGSLEFVTDQVGTHTLKFELFPYLDAEVTINAV